MMSAFVRVFTAIAFLLGVVSSTVPSLAQPSGPIQINSGVQYEFLARWEVDRLNRILTTDTPKFSGVPVTYSPAKNALRLYRVTDASVIPERGDKPTVATGLIAIPDPSDATFPIVSYQHGPFTRSNRCPPSPNSLPRPN
jgi:hypothetical protein